MSEWRKRLLKGAEASPRQLQILTVAKKLDAEGKVPTPSLIAKEVPITTQRVSQIRQKLIKYGQWPWLLR